eukprot:Awhi_evm1s14881
MSGNNESELGNHNDSDNNNQFREFERESHGFSRDFESNGRHKSEPDRFNDIHFHNDNRFRGRERECNDYEPKIYSDNNNRVGNPERKRDDLCRTFRNAEGSREFEPCFDNDGMSSGYRGRPSSPSRRFEPNFRRSRSKNHARFNENGQYYSRNDHNSNFNNESNRWYHCDERNGNIKQRRDICDDDNDGWDGARSWRNNRQTFLDRRSEKDNAWRQWEEDRERQRQRGRGRGRKGRERGRQRGRGRGWVDTREWELERDRDRDRDYSMPNFQRRSGSSLDVTNSSVNLVSDEANNRELRYGEEHGNNNELTSFQNKRKSRGRRKVLGCRPNFRHHSIRSKNSQSLCEVIVISDDSEDNVDYNFDDDDDDDCCIIDAIEYTAGQER